MKKILLASSILGIALSSSLVHAQTKVIVKPKTNATSSSPYPSQNYSTQPSNAIGAPPAAAAPTPAPAPKKSPWRLVYFGEYVGPQLGNFDLSQTQAPDSPTSSYTVWFNSLKLGYAVSDRVVLGASARGDLSFDPQATSSFTFYNIRFYGSWAHMIETSDIDMQQVVETELPTTDASRNKGLIVRFNIKNNWTIKTSLRNWFFSFQTLISPRFYNSLSSTSTDLYLGIFPWITMDLTSDLQLLFEGSFDAGHVYQETFFDFNGAELDYVNVGLLWALSSHVQVNPALRFYTSDLSPSKANIYFSLTAAL